MDYKDTLLIPKTDFDMRGNLVTKEPNIQKIWKEKEIYQKLLNSNKNGKSFFLHDGPPYANGNLHIGHALNKILKDIIIRYKNNLGYFSPFICGWDTHGLPIENAISKNKKIKTNELSINELRKLCKEYALSQVKIQSEQFERLGIASDFNNKYLTLNLEYQLEQLELFKLMCQKNLVYRNMKPIYWSPSSKSALAEAEIEYKNLVSPSIYVTFNIQNSNNSKIASGTKVIIWTTTPWTIPSNLLLAVGNEINYVLFEHDKEKYIVAEELLNNIKSKLNFDNVKIIDKFKGKDLIGLTTKHPLYDRNSKIVSGHHVTTSAGTGIVHIAPGFGEDDYLIGKKENVDIFVPINDFGKFTNLVNDPDLENLFYEKANPIIIDKLKKFKNLLLVEDYEHQYPVDWRTKKPVIFRATKQWFVSIDKIKKNLLNEIDNVEWKQTWAKPTMINMIKDRVDWCISRQRVWGVPIIAFYDENKNPVIDSNIVEHVIKLFRQSNSIDIWFEWDADKLLPEKYQNKGWTKEKDIMDVWFDSGSSNLYINKYSGFKIPVDLFLEGRDQFRGWFNSSLITSVIKYNKAPYKKVITHGFVSDEKGYKMSKSQGNGIELSKICNRYGADILRLWVLSVDYSSDARIGDNIIKQISDSYRKIRNTIRFILGNLHDFDFDKDSTKELSEPDHYILFKTQEYKNNQYKDFDNYNFHTFYLKTMKFINNDLSSFYLDFIKDILYIDKKDGVRRRQVQTTLYFILETLLDCLKPVLTHTSEEVYQSFNKNNKKESIFLEKNQKIPFKFDPNLIKKWDKVMEFRNDINKALEISRKNQKIKKSLETKITVCVGSEFKFLKDIKDLHQILIISELCFSDKNDNLDKYNTAFIGVENKQGKKCVRCWMIVDQLKNDEICEKCFNVLN